MSLKQNVNRNRGECCMTIKRFAKKPTQTLVVVIAMTLLAGPLATRTEAQGKASEAASRAKIRLAIPAPSLSYLVI